ncbi:hypothetical protein Patl1_33028 [Pistacia atlantica]|uniref:Uncharacterized protein n=1 Tax=Pistacia atlantica TaxID=434234 RepID=A0ACC1AP65_9ROSI|nr:hypothetical protein Patl1_33028 [Pistacia atlantica]
MVKTKFLEDVGLIQNPNEAERAVKPFRGRGEQLQERFDCIVNAGLDRKDRIKLRLSMYKLLTEQGKAEPMLALSTLIACSNNTFMKRREIHQTVMSTQKNAKADFLITKAFLLVLAMAIFFATVSAQKAPVPPPSPHTGAGFSVPVSCSVVLCFGANSSFPWRIDMICLEATVLKTFLRDSSNKFLGSKLCQILH